MNKITKTISLVFLIALIVIQFIRPVKNEAGYKSVTYFENETKPSNKVKAVLKNKCYDCHSNQTTYPWYAEIAPVSYWLANHVDEGKGHFNISDWKHYEVKKKDHKLEELIEEVEKSEMPLSSYTWIHGSLKEEEKELLINWAQQLRAHYSVE